MTLLHRFMTVSFQTASVVSSIVLLAGAASAQQTTPPAQRPLETPPPPPTALQPTPPPATTKNESKPKRLRFGPEVGVYLPTNGKAQDRFGKTWTNIGIGIGGISDIHRSRRIALDISFISNSRNSEEKIFLAPIGLAYSVGLGKQDRPTAAYAGVSADLVVASLRSDQDRLPTRTSVTGGASVFLGTRFSESGYAEVRYNGIAKIRGFDLSGINLSAGFRF